MAEEALGATAVYRTYTAEDYQEKTYDEVCLDRARNNMDDLYLLNPDPDRMRRGTVFRRVQRALLSFSYHSLFISLEQW